MLTAQFLKQGGDRLLNCRRFLLLTHTVGSYHIVCLYNFCLLLPTVTCNAAYIVAYTVAYVLFVNNWHLDVMNIVPEGRFFVYMYISIDT